MGRHVPVTMILALILTMAGCAFRGPKAAQTFPGVPRSANVVALDQPAWQLVAVQNQQIDRSADGRMIVSLELANLSTLDLDILAQTQFRGQDDAPLGEATPFEVLVLPGNSSKVYKVTSLQPGATSYTVSLKTP